MISKKVVLASVVLAGVLGATGARAASNVYWSIGIQAPIDAGVALGTVISNAPPPRPAPVYVQPAPVVYAPAPVYVQPRPVYYQPRPVYVHPRPEYVHPRLVYVRPVPIAYGGWARAAYRHPYGHDAGPRAYRRDDRRGGESWPGRADAHGPRDGRGR